jgi:hypothetical protein
MVIGAQALFEGFTAGMTRVSRQGAQHRRALSKVE